MIQLHCGIELIREADCGSPRRKLMWLSCLVTMSWAAAAIGWTTAACADEQPARPNILLIYADDQSYKTVGCYPGSFPWVQTPNIDRLAAEGMRFAGAYLGSWCMPSRASMLTGRLPHGIESMRMDGAYPGSSYDPAQCPFWPSVFRQHGYQTAQIGKWHTGVDTGFGRDWDYQVVWNRPKHPDNAGAYYTDQITAINGEERLVSGYPTDNYTEWACQYIRGQHRRPDQPWYLWLCYGAIHGPSIPAQRHRGQYANADVPTPADIFPPRPTKPDYLNLTQAWFRDADGQARMGKSGEAFGDDSAKQARTHAAFVRQMNECVPAIDEGVAQLLAALQETGQLDNTLVIYTADQGFSMGEHGFRTKLAPYDANYRSPLIVRYPPLVAPAGVCEQTASAPDLVATCFELAGIPCPWTMHGRSLTPLLRNPSADWPHATLYEHVGQSYGSDVGAAIASGRHQPHNNVPWYVAIRQGAYKYIRTLVAGETEELYDLRSDPEELNNLASQPEHRQRLTAMRGETLAELRRTEASFVEQLPPTRQMQKEHP